MVDKLFSKHMKLILCLKVLQNIYNCLFYSNLMVQLSAATVSATENEKEGKFSIVLKICNSLQKELAKKKCLSFYRRKINMILCL